MRKLDQPPFTGLWVGCAQTSGWVVCYGLFIHARHIVTHTAVYIHRTFTTSLAHFLYSAVPSQNRNLTSVSGVLFHTIHSTYNYTQFGKKNTFIIRVWSNQEAV